MRVAWCTSMTHVLLFSAYIVLDCQSVDDVTEAFRLLAEVCTDIYESSERVLNVNVRL